MSRPMKRFLLAVSMLSVVGAAAAGCEKKGDENKDDKPLMEPAALERDALAVLEEMATIIEANQEDCRAMGTKLEEALKKRGEELGKLQKAAAQLTPEQKRATDERTRANVAPLKARIEPALMKCKDHASVQDAIKKFAPQH